MPISHKIGNRVKVDFAILEIKNNNVEEGIECFSHWSSIEDGNCEVKRNNQLTLTVFEREKNKLLLHDNLCHKHTSKFLSHHYVVFHGENNLIIK